MTTLKNMTIDYIGSVATEQDVEYVRDYLLAHGYAPDAEINDIRDADWKAACDYAATNDRLNAYCREDCGGEWEDRAWKVWREEDNGERWYIPADDDRPADDNVVEGATGELLYLDREDAIDQWGYSYDLQGLADGQESGVVIYPGGETIICNWSHEARPDSLPRVSLGGLVYLPDESLHLVADAMPTTYSVADLPDEMEVVYEANDGDAEAFAEAVRESPQRAWELPDGTLIVAPEGWN